MNEFAELEAYLRRVPGIHGSFGNGRFDNGNWWFKFKIDIDHPLAWNVVQEFGNVLNYLSVTERLPTVFMPVSPPPYLNGGPREFLSWVIESTAGDFSPRTCSEWLEGRLPRPIDDLSQWQFQPEDEGAQTRAATCPARRPPGTNSFGCNGSVKTGTFRMPRSRFRTMLIALVPSVVFVVGTFLVGMSAILLSDSSCLPNLIIMMAGTLAVVTTALTILVFFEYRPKATGVDSPLDRWDRELDG